MNYPFLYQSLDCLNIQELKNSLVFTNEKYTVWADWELICIESDFLRNYLSKKFSHLKIYENRLFLSSGTQCNFHIDRYQIHHLLHRILIPLDDNFKYEWIVDGHTEFYAPKIGEVLLFNNMVPHRFVSTSQENRQVIYIDLFDPLVEGFFDFFKGNYSLENAALADKYN